MNELKWEPNDYGNFEAKFSAGHIEITIGAISHTVYKKQPLNPLGDVSLMKQPYFEMYVALFGEYEDWTMLGRCRYTIGVDALHDKTLTKARAWLKTRLDALPIITRTPIHKL